MHTQQKNHASLALVAPSKSICTNVGCVLQEIVAALPELLGLIQGQLLDLLSLVLARRPHREGLPQLHLNALHQAVAHGPDPLIF